MAWENRLAFHDLFQRHSGEVAAYLRARWPKEPEVPDLVQEAFLRLWEYREAEVIRDPYAFLLHTADHLAIDRHRRRVIRERHAAHVTTLDSIVDREVATPERAFEAEWALARFRELLAGLPPLRRHAFVLYRIEGLSHAEIAARLGISVRSSERYVRQALHHFVDHLDPLPPADPF